MAGARHEGRRHRLRCRGTRDQHCEAGRRQHHVADGCFDAAYSFEAIAHTPDRDVCFNELWRLLRPGGQIALAEWCLTGLFDESDPVHRDIRDRVEFANAAPDLPTTSQSQGRKWGRSLSGGYLATGVNHLVRRGIDRGYVERREDLAGIRGKMLGVVGDQTDLPMK